MSTDRYLNQVNGQLAEAAAVAISSGVGEANKIVALGTDGRLDVSLMPVGIGPDTSTVIASENLSAGDLINMYNALGVAKCRKADCSNGRRAHGFILESVSADSPAAIYTDATITGLTILPKDAGVPLYLYINGAWSLNPPTTAGYISQEIGYVVSTTEAKFEPQQPITLA